MSASPLPHPVGEALRRAAAGEFPSIDGRVEIVPPWRPGLAAVVSFTGHAFVALDSRRPLAPEVVPRLDGFGGAHDPRVAAAIAGPDGWIDSLDVVLTAIGTGDRAGRVPVRGVGSVGSVGSARTLVPRPELADHPRAAHAGKVRDEVRCIGRPTGDAFVTIGRGIGGMTEIGIEVLDGDALLDGTAGAAKNAGDENVSDGEVRGTGRELLIDALTLAPAGDVVVAAVAPGNARALRSFLAAGFRPVGGIQLIVPTH